MCSGGKIPVLEQVCVVQPIENSVWSRVIEMPTDLSKRGKILFSVLTLSDEEGCV